MAVITKDLAITTKDDRGNQVLYHPFTTVDNVDNAVATVNGVKPDSSGNVQINIPNTKQFAQKDDIYLYVGEQTPTELRENMLVLNPNELNNVIMPSIRIGTVTNGTDANVTNSGTELNPIFNFTLPKGDKGDRGERGLQGIQGVKGLNGKDATVISKNITLLTANWNGNEYTINDSLIKSTSAIFFDIQMNQSLDIYNAMADAKITAKSQTNGSLVLVALETKPTIDLPITLVVI